MGAPGGGGTGSTSEAQNAHLVAVTGMALLQYGHSWLGISASAPRPMRAIRALIGLTTRKKMTVAIIRNEINELRKLP